MDTPPEPPSSGKAKPDLTPRALAQKQERLRREAEALRNNLRRRKQQNRTPDPGDSAPPEAN
jgi:hypothetical protein